MLTDSADHGVDGDLEFRSFLQTRPATTFIIDDKAFAGFCQFHTANLTIMGEDADQCRVLEQLNAFSLDGRHFPVIGWQLTPGTVKCQVDFLRTQPAGNGCCI